METNEPHKSWVEISVEGDTESTEAICEIFQKHGIGDISIEELNVSEEFRVGPQSMISDKPVLIKAYIPDDSHSNTLKQKIYSDIDYLSMIRPIKKLDETIIEETEWAENWKKFFHANKIGNNVVVVPTWEEYKAKNAETIIKLDPGMAFGTGLHPTTQLCLSQAEKFIDNNNTVLDFGTGSGILSIALAQLGAKQIIGIDIDPIAVKIASNNIELNNVSNIVTVVESSSPLDAIDLLNSNDAEKTFDLILANVTTNVLIDNCSQFQEVLHMGGILIGSGILQEQITEFSYFFMDNGFRLIDVVSDGDWRAIVMKKV
jgi:ribosomal protein L11 methyltransferase|tara:strand:- start:4067 stop:5017 length:951 start_codon:yes stop_codon:yes gene_type:complete